MPKIPISCFLLLWSVCFPANAQIRVQYPSFGKMWEATDTASLFIAGDIMMHQRQMEYDCDSFLKNISHLSEAADIAAGNLEFSLAGLPYSGYPSFSAPDGYPRYLADRCGIDVFLAANNHVLDRGETGLRRTLAEYRHMADSCGIKYTGIASGPEEYEDTFPLFVRANGISIALINFTYGSNRKASAIWPKVQLMNKEEIAAAFKRAKEKHADFIVALPHWGEEYVLKHNSSQEEWAEWLIEQGADAIVGSHPHVVQDSCSIKGVPVFYSIGNAVSNMSAINTRVGLAVTLTFTKERKSGTCRMLQPKIDFTWCTLPGMLIDGYATLFIKEWASRKNDWLTPDDYVNMMQSYERVKTACKIED